MASPTDFGYVGLGTTVDTDYVPQPFYCHCDLMILGADGSVQALLTGGKFDPGQASDQAQVGSDHYQKALSGADFPFTLQNWVHTMESDLSDTFTISMLDESYRNLEMMLARGALSLGVQYYYVGPNGEKKNPSPIYQVVVLLWEPEPTMSGLNISLQCIAYLAVPGQKTVSFADSKTDLTLKEVVETVCSGLYDEGTPSKAALKKPWTVDFGGVENEPIGPPELGGQQTPAETARGQMDVMLHRLTSNTNQDIAKLKGVVCEKQFNQVAETDLIFLKRLAHYAKNKEGKGGYVVSLDSETKPNPTLHFRPSPSPAESKIATEESLGNKKTPRFYTYLYGLKNSEVIRFKPTVSVSYFGAESSEVVAPFTDPLTGRTGVTVASAESDDPKRKISPSFEGSTPNIFRRAIDSVRTAGYNILKTLSNPQSAIIAAYNKWYSAFLEGMTAELEIVGDSSVRPWEFIVILVLSPDGYPLSFTGTYLIGRVTHSGSGGSYRTIMELTRTGPALFGTDDPASLFADVSQIRGRSNVLEHRQAEGKEKVPITAGQTASEPSTADQTGKVPSPVCGELGDLFGAPRNGGKRSHEGIDILDNGGRPIRSPVGGEVIVVHNKPGSLSGNFVAVKGDDGYQYEYSHLSDLPTDLRGKRIEAGDTIGHVGGTGDANGAQHLHLEIKDKKGNPIDPLTVIQRPQACPI